MKLLGIINKKKNEDITNKQLIEYLIRQILSGKISFPYGKIYLNSKETFVQHFKTYQPEILNIKYNLFYLGDKLNLIFNGKYQLISSSNYYYLDGFTDLFIEDQRIQSRKSYYVKSTAECWKSQSFLTTILTIMLKQEKIDEKCLREIMCKNHREPSLFKLSWIKGIYQLILPNVKKCRVLDISSGWGDRLLATILMNYDYLGYDPNINLKRGHNEIIKLYGNNKRHRVIYKPFEDANLTNEKEFDICLTSPPFYNLEIFNSENQSIDKYPDFENWLVYFLFSSLMKAWNKIKIGGYLAIHMCDVQKYKICEPMNLFIDKLLLRSSFEGVIGLGSSYHEFVYPLWVWKKIEYGDRMNKFNGDLLTSYPNVYYKWKLHI